MTPTTPDFPVIYHQALDLHLRQGERPDPTAVEEIVLQARTAMVTMLKFSKLHERRLLDHLLPACPAGGRDALIRRAGNFFASVITATSMGNAGKVDAFRNTRLIELLSIRGMEMAESNRQLRLEISNLKKIAAALRKSGLGSLNALEKSELIKDQLRQLSRQVLSAQEEERKKISRELHDVVAQALLGINVRLATLKREAGINTKGMDRNISQTQKLIKKSANIVHQFARELRPAALDDLGLIPALKSFLKNFTTRTGIRAHLTVVEEVEQLSIAKRTVLYRVAQEALANVARHAAASRVDIEIRREKKFLRMDVRDDGKSFQIQPVMSTDQNCLGLLGMRERVEMVGGRFQIESEPGQGTTVIARIPAGKPTGGSQRKGSGKKQS